LPIVFLGVELSLLAWGMNTDWVKMLRTGCWGEYLELR